MRGLVVFLSLLGISAAIECNFTGKKFDIAFPNLNAEGVESYELSVEYTAGKKTDYYTEYYDILYGRGRVNLHRAGKSISFLYRTESSESWMITKDTCELKNLTGYKPKFATVDMTDWMYEPKDEPLKLTIGPSAMFKIAYDVWNSDDKNTTMAYMGVVKNKVRGLDAHLWRRCSSDNVYVNYYFTADKDENPFGIKGLKRLPLRVDMGERQYDIMSFQPYVSLNKNPFELPKGIGCKRGDVKDAPELPSFQGKNLEFHAEVIYRTIDSGKDGEDTQYWSYYSTLYMALDLQSQHVAYTYSPWSKINATTDPKADAPTYYVFDAKHGYLYKTPMDTGKCEIDRLRSFVPEYKLPNGAGGISLTDPSILFPDNEFTFIAEGESRGLRVNIFEEIVEQYIMNRNGTYDPIPKAVITHSYLQDNVMERDTVSVKNSLAQVQLRFYGRKTVETLTFNFFGFTTELHNRQWNFNIKRCFKNEDDYVWATIGFNADADKLKKVINDVPSIQSNILNAITARSELNAVRIPVIEVDVKDGIFVTLLILGKPPVMLDYYEPVKDKTITTAVEVDGVEDLETCATRCLETEDNCWGFSMCGAVCYYGTVAKENSIGDKKGCNYYERFDLEKFIPSKEMLVENLRRQIKQHQGFSLDLKDKDDNIIQIDASSIEVTYPGEDDRIFARLGNTLNPRMRLMKAGYKLKNTAGSTIKNMGKLRYDECQRVCLDFKECETASYCVTDSSCIISTKYEDDIKPEEIVEDNMCNLITRKYADNFVRSPGNVLTTTAEEILDLDTLEKCARACLQQTKFKCLSFDHCPADEKQGCSLHTVHYPNAKTREAKTRKSTDCGHYFRRFSTEFKKSLETRTTGSKLPPLSNLTLEECSTNCIEYGKGTCFGFDFCQGSTMLDTSCTLLDIDPASLKKTYSPVCNNYLRTEEQFAPRPYSNTYAGGIGFLCFLVGGIVGVLIVFGIAYFRVNRR